MPTNSSCWHECRFPCDIISYGVWLYHRFTGSVRDVENLLAQGGVDQDGDVLDILVQRLLSVHGVIRNCFRLGRHSPRAEHYRLLRERSFSACRAYPCYPRNREFRSSTRPAARASRAHPYFRGSNSGRSAMM